MMTRPEHQGARNPYTTVTYHKGYTKDQIKHTILPVNHFTKVEREAVRAFLKPILTGEQAQAMVYREDPVSKKKGHEFGWAYKLDISGRIGVLSFRGTEVAVFYKRQTAEVIPEPGEPIPEGVLAEPIDIWVRFDLMGPSAREKNLFLAQRQSRLEEEIKILNEQLVAKQSLIDSVETENYKLNKRIELLDKRIARMTEEKDGKGKEKGKKQSGKAPEKVTGRRDNRSVYSSKRSTGRSGKGRKTSGAMPKRIRRR